MRNMSKQNSIVIVPPGAYTISTTLNLDATNANTTFYAYGVYQEKDSFNSTVVIRSSSNIAIKGLTCGYSFQSCGQVYVLETFRDGTFRVVTNAGFKDEYGSSSPEFYPENNLIFSSGSLSSRSYSHKAQFIEKCDDGTMIFKVTYKGSGVTIAPGDVLACRYIDTVNLTSIECISVKNVTYKDCVLYGYTGAIAVALNGAGTENFLLERFHNTAHSP